MFCRHQWNYNFPVTLADFITVDEDLQQLGLSLTPARRICQKCKKEEIYETPFVCGGRVRRWCTSSERRAKVIAKAHCDW